MENKSEFWLGLEHYEGDPEFNKLAENEFLTSPLKSEDGQDGLARREFLKLMGASLTMASVSCTRPVQRIIPYAQAPKEITPGEAAYYASTWVDGSEGYGVLVKTLEGRPIKVEGNPLHPMNKGKLPVRAHAEVLHLYDPDRLRAPKRNLSNKERTNYESIDTTFDAADAKIVAQLAKGGVAVLTPSLPSPSLRAILSDFFKVYPGAHTEWDSFSAEDVREAQKRSYGHEVLPRYRFDKAQMIVSVDADFLGTYLSPVEAMVHWAKTREPGSKMARLVVFEGLLSLTGMNADDRIRIKPSQQLDVVMGLLHAVGQVSGHSVAAAAAFADVPARLGIDAKLFTQTAQELWKNRGQSLVIAGGLTAQTEQSVQLQLAVNLLNSLLENDGKTIDYENSPYQTYSGSYASLQNLMSEMKAGKVNTLIIHGVNPMYTLPNAAEFLEATRKVEVVIYTGNTEDETARLSQYILPAGSSFETWGDWELQKGLFSIQQPTLRPLYATRSLGESLHAWTTASPKVPATVKSAETWFDYVKAVWKTEIHAKAKGAPAFEEFWNQVLQNGVVDTVASKRDSYSSVRTASAALGPFKATASAGNYELVIYPTIHMGDGRMANVPWLQELPDPVTKIVWDNYVSVSPATAQKQKLSEGDIVTLKVGSKSVDVPAHIQPGLHDGVIGLSVGYGRVGAGKVAKGIGTNAFALASATANGAVVFAGLESSFVKTGESYKLACPQGHHQLEGRPIVGYTTNENYQKNPHSGVENPHVFSIWPEHKYNKHKWAMSVDLNVCTGCSACVIACQSENNVPVVGKTYVMQGREMHWIRIDRYYVGTPENPDTVMQPMMCQHCENAPCETVCPVLATVHNEEGLNDMVYNRCVGTRYCSNNCPYKVRRFNWFNYSKLEGMRREPLNMALNPDVTVRSRGVMEKCTMCVSRIRKGTTIAKVAGVDLKDGDIKTACEQTCPTSAIVFGDLNDPESRVAKLFTKSERIYGVLAELNTKPRVRYHSKIRNADRVIVERPELPSEGKSI
jgi:molybdopterin-containing oxidoreductase family iron-sulfur binding subunit